MNMALTDPATVSVEEIDVSDPTLYQTDGWRPWFSRLRAEDPVHWSEKRNFRGLLVSHPFQ